MDKLFVLHELHTFPQFSEVICIHEQGAITAARTDGSRFHIDACDVYAVYRNRANAKAAQEYGIMEYHRQKRLISRAEYVAAVRKCDGFVETEKARKLLEELK
jgi:hypothetical protein